MNNFKYLGFFFIIIGFLIIGLTLFYSYNIATGNSNAPEIFRKIEKEENNQNMNNIEFQVNQIIKEEIRSIISTEVINNLLNLISWSFFAFIFIFGGSKISLLGINIVKKQ